MWDWLDVYHVAEITATHCGRLPLTPHCGKLSQQRFHIPGADIIRMGINSTTMYCVLFLYALICSDKSPGNHIDICVDTNRTVGKKSLI